jgi:hypothetical protein
MIVVDTSVWIDFFAGNENLQSLWLRSEVGRPSIALTDLILCEVLQGIRGEQMFTKISRQLAEFPIFSTGSQELALASARNFRSLRARGVTVRKTIDCIIATHCIRHGHALLHRDRDFDPFEKYLGLRVIHPNTQ